MNFNWIKERLVNKYRPIRKKELVSIGYFVQDLENKNQELQRQIIKMDQIIAAIEGLKVHKKIDRVSENIGLMDSFYLKEIEVSRSITYKFEITL